MTSSIGAFQAAVVVFLYHRDSFLPVSRLFITMSHLKSENDSVPLLNDVENRSGNNHNMIVVKVKCNDVGEVEMEVTPDETIDELKQKLISKLNIAADKRVRLISAGKLLEPGTKKLVEFSISHGSFIHCVVSNAPALATAIPSSSSAGGLNIDQQGGLNEFMDRSNGDVMWRTTPVANFNLLGEAEYSPLGSNRDFFLGLMMGYLVGGIMLFCVWDRGVSHRQKVGILMGVTLQIITSILQGQPSNHTPSQSQLPPAQGQQPAATGSSATTTPLSGQQPIVAGAGISTVLTTIPLDLSSPTFAPTVNTTAATTTGERIKSLITLSLSQLLVSF